jgi:hypothetical protein
MARSRSPIPTAAQWQRAGAALAWWAIRTVAVEAAEGARQRDIGLLALAAEQAAQHAAQDLPADTAGDRAGGRFGRRFDRALTPLGAP